MYGRVARHTHTLRALYLSVVTSRASQSCAIKCRMLHNGLSGVTQRIAMIDMIPGHALSLAKSLCLKTLKVMPAELDVGHVNARRVRRRTRRCPQSQTSDTSMPTVRCRTRRCPQSQTSDTSMPTESDVGHVNALPAVRRLILKALRTSWQDDKVSL